MVQITATELKSNLGKYLLLAQNQDIYITKSGTRVVKLAGVKPDKVKDIESLFGVAQTDGTDLEASALKQERLASRYESIS